MRLVLSNDDLKNGALNQKDVKDLTIHDFNVDSRLVYLCPIIIYSTKSGNSLYQKVLKNKYMIESLINVD